MKCDNKECNRNAFLRMKNNVARFQINVCYTHFKELKDNWDLGKWDIGEIE